MGQRGVFCNEPKSARILPGRFIQGPPRMPDLARDAGILGLTGGPLVLASWRGCCVFQTSVYAIYVQSLAHLWLSSPCPGGVRAQPRNAQRPPPSHLSKGDVRFSVEELSVVEVALVVRQRRSGVEWSVIVCVGGG